MSPNFSFSFNFNMRRTQESLRQMCIKSEFMVASDEPMYDSKKLKLVSVSSGAPRLFDAVWVE